MPFSRGPIPRTLPPTPQVIRGWLRSVCLVAAILFAVPVHAQDVALPEEQQLSLYARVLPFDRNLMERAEDEIVIGVLYQSGFRASVRAKDAIMGAAHLLATVGGVPTRFVPIEASSAAVLQAALEEKDVHLLYVTPVRSLDLAALVALCESHRLPSITGVPEYVDQGVAVGIGERGGRPDILLNKDAADAAGMDFDSRLLQLVTLR
jgi:hypothetical protein